MLAELTLGTYLRNIIRKPTAYFLARVYIELSRARTGKTDKPRLPLRRMVKEKFLISTNYLDNNLQNFTY